MPRVATEIASDPDWSRAVDISLQMEVSYHG